MRKRPFVTAFLFSMIFMLFMCGHIFAQGSEFERGVPIPVPEPELNKGGIGNIVTNVDFDDDGKMDLYIINHNWGDAAEELIPRIYKYERNGDAWEMVWKATLDSVYAQNTWPALTWSDLDQDGLKEIIWAPVEWVDETNAPNPDRLFVFEQSADGGDVLGISDGKGNYLPNSKWTISSEDNDSVRPLKMVALDVDKDNVIELIFSDRRATVGGWFFGVCSVDDIPDDGDGSETWTLEARGQELGLTGAENKYDMTIMEGPGGFNIIYLFDELECSRVKATGPDTYELLPAQKSVLKDAGGWKSAVTTDIDGNGAEEIIAGTFWNTLPTGETHGIYVYTDTYPQGTTDRLDTLLGVKVAELGDYLTGYGVMGGAVGDIDQDGNKEFIFGSRNASPNGALFRLEYVGPNDSILVADYWELSLIDSIYPDVANNGRWDIVNIANMDDDPLLEVLYSSTVPAAPSMFDPAAPVPLFVIENTTELVEGPWTKTTVPYRFEKRMNTDLGSGHGITVDKYGRIWYGEFDGDDAVKIFAADGTPIDTLSTLTVTTPTGQTDIAMSDCRGLGLDIDGNIIYAKSSHVIKIDVDSHEAIAYLPFPGSPLNPAVDDQGYIYIGYVVNVSPIEVIDPATFQISQSIVLPNPPGFARGMDVSLDGLSFYPGDLTADPHAVPIYTSVDYTNYFKTDSIYTDKNGNVIMNLQTVTASTKPNEGTIWYSLDNAYGSGGNDQLDNSLVMMNFDTYEYGYLYMPPPSTPSGRTGPRGAAWSVTGDTLYVASWGEGAIYMYVYDETLSLEGDRLAVPSIFDLRQNYPNPFNPVTDIEFTIDQPGKASLVIYNMLGQKVVTLVNQNLPRGTFKVQFDASQYASGTYIYTLRSAGKQLSKKMTLLK
jgi:hypothetical protein